LQNNTNVEEAFNAIAKAIKNKKPASEPAPGPSGPVNIAENKGSAGKKNCCG